MLALELPRASPEDRDVALRAMANTLACALDESLIGRVGNFAWRDACLHGAPEPLQAVPSNRYDRAALHLWHMVCEPSRVELGAEEAQNLHDLLDDCLKIASRLHGGKLRAMMEESVWRRVRDNIGQLLRARARA